MTPKIIDKTAKREAILNAALQAFSKRGFKNTKIIDIAEAAGIGKGTVYEYFKNKDEMLAAAFQSLIKEGQNVVETILQKPITPLQKLGEILKQLMEFYGKDLHMTHVFFDFWIEGVHNHEKPEIDFKPIYAEYRVMLQSLIKEAIASGEVRADVSEHTASVFVGVMEGLFLQWLVDPQAFPLVDITDEVLDTLFRGIKTGDKNK